MKYVWIGLAAAAVLAAIVLLIRACGKKTLVDGPGMEMQSYRQIIQEEAKQMMAKNDGHVIVDVRRQDEYDGGHIPGAICIPNESIETTPPPELPDKEQIILIYCRSGRRSKEAAQKLFDMGYSQIYEFGGILTWTGEIETVPETLPEARPVLVIDAGGAIFYAHFEEGPAAKAFIEKISSAGLTLEMRDYGGFEKVASLPFDLPRSDASFTTQPGDIMLYQGDQLCLYYGENTWELTRLARVGSRTDELREALGDGAVSVTFSLEWPE